MRNTESFWYKNRHRLATSYRSDYLGRYMIGEDLKKGSSIMQDAYKLYEDLAECSQHLSWSEIRRFIRDQGRWSIALFGVSENNLRPLYGIQPKNAHICSMGSNLRRMLGDWRGEDQKQFPNEEILHRGSVMQTLVIDTDRPVASSSAYRDMGDQVVQLETAWVKLPITDRTEPVICTFAHVSFE